MRVFIPPRTSPHLIVALPCIADMDPRRQITSIETDIDRLRKSNVKSMEHFDDKENARAKMQALCRARKRPSFGSVGDGNVIDIHR